MVVGGRVVLVVDPGAVVVVVDPPGAVVVVVPPDPAGVRSSAVRE